jgi:hypothetical protein
MEMLSRAFMQYGYPPEHSDDDDEGDYYDEYSDYDDYHTDDSEDEDDPYYDDYFPLPGVSRIQQHAVCRARCVLCV